MSETIRATFLALAVVFLFILCQFFIPVIREFFGGSLLFLLPFIIFSLLGILLIVLTIKGETNKTIKKFLLLTGISALGFFLSIFFHNAFYALGTLISHIIVLKYLIGAINIAFFIIAIFACPLGFLVGAVGSIVLFIRNKNRF